MNRFGEPMAQTVGVRIAIVGTTASGKSALAERIATNLGVRGRAAEIVSADSMCVYRGMDIGTAKPTPADQRQWPTHGIDLVDPNQEFSVAEFQRYALGVLREIEQRGAVAILVGGTGLYLDAVVNELTMPPQFPVIKQALIDELANGVRAQELHARLVVLDPEAATKMEANNERRIVRALEVCLGSGRPFSSFGPGLVAAQGFVGPRVASDNVDQLRERGEVGKGAGLAPLASPAGSSGSGASWVLCGPTWARQVLRQRIADRFSQQLVDGFVDEARRILDQFGETRSKTARQALGYRELWSHLEGECSLEEAVERAILRTGQFAVRQERWFRRDPRINWISGEALALSTSEGKNRTMNDTSTASHSVDEVERLVNLVWIGMPVFVER